jgi:hypothetical protein
MDAIELTKLFVEYRETADRLAALEAQIAAEVLALGKSQTIANVKATYYSPSVEVDWASACEAAEIPDNIVAKYTVTKDMVSWAKVAAEAGILGDDYKTEKPPRVVVKVV